MICFGIEKWVEIMLFLGRSFMDRCIVKFCFFFIVCESICWDEISVILDYEWL